MQAGIVTRLDIARLERQLQRLRNRLADAWKLNCPPAVIHRLEWLMQRHWQRLERIRHHNTHDPQPE